MPPSQFCDWRSEAWSWIWSTFRLYWFRMGYRRVKRFARWFPVIWRDEDWSEAYLLEIMRFKISQIRAETARYNRHTTSQKCCREMAQMEYMLARVFNGDETGQFEKPDLCQCEDSSFRDCIGPDGKWNNPFCTHCKKFALDRGQKNADYLNEYMWRFFAKKHRRWWN